MLKKILFLFAAIFTIPAFSQDAEIPQAIRVPGGNKLIIHAYAKGIQIYSCVREPKDTSHYVWSLKEPRADLYSDNTYRTMIGKHYFDTNKSPNWEMNDGSRVTGIKLQQVNLLDSLAIPWLLLKAVPVNKGVLSQAVFIQRIRTKGGKVLIRAERLRIGQTMEIPYTAEYLFYKNK